MQSDSRGDNVESYRGVVRDHRLFLPNVLRVGRELVQPLPLLCRQVCPLQVKSELKPRGIRNDCLNH